MDRALDDELTALRRRAYGPDADIQHDPDALRRLRELEEAAQPERPPAVEPDQERPPAIEPPTPAPPRSVTSGRRAVLLGRLALRRLTRVRRSTFWMALGLAVVAAVCVVALILVQRVQSDPLQVGAQQVARLSPDSSLAIPGVFTRPGEESTTQGFQEFHGLRPVITDGALFGTEQNEVCLTVFSVEALSSATDNSFSGFARSGCQARDFPAMTQFSTTVQDAPAALGSAFPGKTALQFVYDRANNEVVVFLSE